MLSQAKPEGKKLWKNNQAAARLPAFPPDYSQYNWRTIGEKSSSNSYRNPFVPADTQLYVNQNSSFFPLWWQDPPCWHVYVVIYVFFLYLFIFLFSQAKAGFSAPPLPRVHPGLQPPSCCRPFLRCALLCKGGESFTLIFMCNSRWT